MMGWETRGQRQENTSKRNDSRWVNITRRTYSRVTPMVNLLTHMISRKRNRDIEPKTNSSAPADHSGNTFKFDFLSDTSPALQEKTSPSNGTEPAARRISFTGQGSGFTFDFQVPAVENMETTDIPDTSTPASQKCVQEEKPLPSQEVNSPPEQLKAKKKKKKSGKKKPTDGTEAQQTASSAEGNQGGDDTELSAEEQLNRQLDWCIEKLESGMRSQKGTPKLKEETSRALKTLRSSKAPLAKKRQVMRAMTGDYRKKMDEDKSKQYKLIQSELASTQVKVVSDPPKKSVFHRKADAKTPTSDREENLEQTEAQDKDLKALTQKETSDFAFTPSKEEFHFNFL
ncbi:UPF0488 protein C8orf33 homolog isoform X2 [Cottoperca gobio]|uniref:UPF0488 protein C8orf33 homolog isoform X2 n=1 Tax=Cottoperca gobio TaxID=56716 RepID=A0A6J2RQ09_COTGO|nr:UPF0488 protein C8orf33 homolog isoform X2 [Cottoperca gobio]